MECWTRGVMLEWWVKIKVKVFKIKVKVIIVSVQVKCGCDWCYGNEDDDDGNLGTIVGTCKPGSGYDLKVKWNVRIIPDNLDYWYRSKGKYDLEVVQYSLNVYGLWF